MKTLSEISINQIKLTNRWNGYYEYELNNILITISKSENNWQIIIADSTGDDEDGTYLIFNDWFINHIFHVLIRFFKGNFKHTNRQY